MRIRIKRAFTLAEVMLSISIIGVIAALTIPALANNYRRHVFAVEAKKNLTTIESMLTSAQVDTFASTLNRTGLTLRANNTLGDIRNRITSYLDIEYEASNTTAFASSYRSVDSGNSSEFKCEDGTIFVLQSGSAFCYIPGNANAVVIIDSNGAKPPNTGGKDIFTYNISNDFSITDAGDCTSSEIGAGCLNRLMDNDWKINY